VVYGHVSRGLVQAGIEANKSLFTLADSVIYSFHMPLFFFLSGLYFYHSLNRRGVRGLIQSKVDAILYPYLLWSILQGLIEVQLSKTGFTNGSLTYAEVFSSLLIPRAQFWFLYALFTIFVLASLVFKFLNAKSVVVVLALSALAYIFQSTLAYQFIKN